MKECNIVGSQNILWPTTTYFQGSQDHPNPQDLRLCTLCACIVFCT